MEISDPQSEKYGQHMSAKEVGDLFRPSDESIDAVREWLHSSGIDNERHDISAGRGWLKFDASVDELESLLATEYHLFHHLPTKEDHIGCNEYHIPQHIQEHIDFITPTVTFSKLKSGKKVKRGTTEGKSPASLKPHFTPAGASEIPLKGNSDVAGAAPGSEIPCYTAVTPDCLRRKSA
jgi:tripeptidyl-peptidase-1